MEVGLYCNEVNYMSLLDIKALIVAELGYKLANSGEIALFNTRLNKAALEVFMLADLDGSLDEDVFDFYTTTQQVVVPHYVGLVRGGRYYDSRVQVPVDHMVNRYHDEGFSNETWYLKFREVAKSPLQRDIENASIITFSIPAVESEDIILYIQGETDRSSTFKETITIAAGNLTASTIEQYSRVRVLTKNRLTNYDITTKDVEDNILAVIPNDRKSHQYTIWQVSESEQPYSQTTTVELLYKVPFYPLEQDGDQFLGSDKYDLAIVYKFMQHRAKKDNDIANFMRLCNQAINIAHTDAEPGGKRMKINFAPAPYQNIPYGYYGSTRL